MSGDAYRDAGVDIEAGEALVDKIRPFAKRASRPEVLGGLGGFGGLFALGKYRDPVLVSGTDGVGTKLLLAQRLDQHRTIGIDLVAMCVNDIAVCGAEPLFFLDYFATGKLDVDRAAAVVEGIAQGCTLAGCALLGGETAEMPGMYAPGHYDLAGFAVGVVERDALLDGSAVQSGAIVLGLPSSGLHSNGYSLARKVLVEPEKFDLAADPGGLGAPLGELLLRPTRIYVAELATLRDRFGLLAAAHVTGGGIVGNLPRVLPAGLGATLRRRALPKLPIFELLQREGDLTERDMDRTFNRGIGMCALVPPDQAERAAAEVGAVELGRIEPGEGIRWVS
ncbi:MAG: phosphoribosylformylglycinamidine cyclo-ligase [Deltaproteobacteria bacterium]|nr:MAG: phosphoribosylformylglycinamidine cyclo-ligase [Deltaproteobacteria bacterium]